MNLLMISGDRSTPQGRKGAFWYTLEELSKHFQRVDVICPRAAGSDLHPFDNVHVHPSPRGLWYQPWWIARRGRELLAAHRHGVATVHEYPPFYNGLGARWLHFSTGVPYVLEVHHIVGHPRASSLAEWLGWWSSRWCLAMDARGAAAVRVVNTSVGDQLVRWGVPVAKVHVVPSFYLDRDALVPDPSIPKRYDIALCARLVANKGLEEVLEAVHSLSGVSLLIIGDGPERSRAERRVTRYDMRGRVTFLGWLPSREDVYRAIQSARVFVMNSRSEGGPRVVLEAMAVGMPVLATCVGVMPDVIAEGRNGFFTDGTPVDLAAKLRHLLQDGELRGRLGIEAQRILDRFERGAAVKIYADFLKGMGSSRSSDPSISSSSFLQ